MVRFNFRRSSDVTDIKGGGGVMLLPTRTAESKIQGSGQQNGHFK